METQKLVTIALSLALGTLWAFNSPAQSVPSLINYQGKLVDAVGNPLSNGAYEVVFKIWNKANPAEPGERLIWGQTNQVAVIKGIFNVVLGGSSGGIVEGASTRDISQAFGEAERFLGFTITRNPSGPMPSPSEIAPRQQILSAPYAMSAFNGIPPGCVLPFGGVNVPDGFLLCDGRAVSSSAYPKLFAAIGKQWGSGDGGANDFNLPDLRGRMVLGAGQGQGLSNRTLADKGGEETHTLTVAEMPAHTHSHNGNANDSTAGHEDPISRIYVGGPVNGINSNSTGGGQPHNNMPPYAVVNHIIKY